MGFASKWATRAPMPQATDPKDNMDTLDTIHPLQPRKASSVHTVHIVPKRSTGETDPEPQPVPSDASSMAALARFEKNPVGVVHWLGQQRQGQPAHLTRRWAACIRAEARLWSKEEAGPCGY
jgi:hypothetical protein